MEELIPIEKYYDRIMGSKIWPSTDPKDSPFDKFVCKICGSEFSIQMFGCRSIYEESFEKKAYIILERHIGIRHGFKPPSLNNCGIIE